MDKRMENKEIDTFIPNFPFEEIKKIGDSLVSLQKSEWLHPDDSDAILAFLCDKIFEDKYAKDDYQLIDSPYSRYLCATELKRKSHMDNTTEGRPRDVALDFLIFAIVFDLKILHKRPYWEIVEEFLDDNGIEPGSSIRNRHSGLSLEEVAKNFICCYGLSSDLRKRVADFRDVKSPFVRAYIDITEKDFTISTPSAFIQDVKKKILDK